MINYNNIPLEIWVNVFNFFEQPIYLLECRLVCKRWNHPAETAMFSKHLEVSHSDSIRKLFNHLAKRPSRAHLVRHLDAYSFDEESDSENSAESDILKLIKVAFNPNLKHWGAGGEPVDSKAISAVLEIIEGLPKNTVYQLQTMPESSIQNDENYAKLAYIMRNTLQYLAISATRRPMNTYLGKLAVFRYLTDLKLDAEDLESIAALDSILKNCPHLILLDLISPTNNYVEQDRDTLAIWMTKNVNKVDSMIELTLDSAQPDLIEYLAYKYPKMEFIEFSVFPAAPFRYNQASRIFTALKNFRYFSTKYSLVHHQELLNSIPMICDIQGKSTGIDAEIIYGRGIHYDPGVEFKLGEHNGLIYFSVHLAIDSSTRVHTDILDQIRALNDNHKLLRLKTSMLCSQPVPNDTMLTFFQIMAKFPTLTYLMYEWKQIKCEPMETKINLTRLEICYAKIDAKVLPQISRSCPKLRGLLLKACSIVDNKKHPEKVYSINLPSTSLHDFSVLTPPPFYGTDISYAKSMEIQNSVTGNCYVKVSLLEDDMHFYYRLNSTERPVVLSQSQFKARPRRPEDATFFVTCALILNLRFYINKNIRSVINMKESLSSYVTMTDSEKIQLQMEKITLGAVAHSYSLNNATRAIQKLNQLEKEPIVY